MKCSRCFVRLGGNGEAEDHDLCVSCYCEEMGITEEEYLGEE